ncbi:MAG: nitrogenase component 1 [Bacillota bacterium]|nr:nitrogenase component 1 [Bacillota bacterium]
MASNYFIEEDATSKESKKGNSKPLEAPRYACAFGGAYAAVINISKAIPVGHAGGGCIFNQTFGTNFAGGYQGVGYIGGTASPSCNLSEKEVIFGGEKRLKEQLTSTIELVEGDLYVVLGACIPAMIGDDIEGVVKETIDETGAKILYLNVPGFSGNSYHGYNVFFDAAINQLLEKPNEKISGLVNIIGIPPCLNPYWKGTVKELRRVFKNLGLKPNFVFGYNEGLESLLKLSAAELTIVLSPWVGVSAAKLLKEKFDVPYLIHPSIPVGPKATTELLREVSTILNIDKNLVDQVLDEEEKDNYWLLDLAADTVGMLSPSLHVAIVADSATAIGTIKFLVNDAGYYPVVASITDDPPEDVRNQITKEFENLAYNLKPEVIFEEDTYNIHKLLKTYNFGLLLASSLEKYLAPELQAIYLNVAYPATDRFLIDRTYAGYKGALTLLEDIHDKFIQPF